MNTTQHHYFSVPSKTFLIGEYAVLKEAPAVLINTPPRFKFYFKEKKIAETISAENLSTENGPKKKAIRTEHTKQVDGQGVWKNPLDCFHPRGGAGKWLKKHPELSKLYRVKVEDPYKGKGGFGFSSAEFLFVYGLSCLSSHLPWDIHSVWKAYKELESVEGDSAEGGSHAKLIPSGADLVSQWVGGLCVFSQKPFSAYSLAWPFKDLDFFLLRTGGTLNTWEHLKNLSDKIFPPLSLLAKKAQLCIDEVDTKGFVEVLQKYASCLEEQRLVTKDTQKYLDRIKKHKAIVVAKGCGAMGAETVAVFFHPKDKQEVKNFLEEKNILASAKDITYGVKTSFTKLNSKQLNSKVRRSL